MPTYADIAPQEVFKTELPVLSDKGFVSSKDDETICAADSSRHASLCSMAAIAFGYRLPVDLCERRCRAGGQSRFASIVWICEASVTARVATVQAVVSEVNLQIKQIPSAPLLLIQSASRRAIREYRSPVFLQVGLLQGCFQDWKNHHERP
jgi:hypothetical protein